MPHRDHTLYDTTYCISRLIHSVKHNNRVIHELLTGFSFYWLFQESELEQGLILGTENNQTGSLKLHNRLVYSSESLIRDRCTHMIDIQTALTMIALCHLACGTSMALIWFRNRRTRGIADWTISRLFLVIAYTLYASQLSFNLSIFSAVILSNAFLFISFYLMWRGYAKFMLVQPRYAFVIWFM